MNNYLLNDKLLTGLQFNKKFNNNFFKVIGNNRNNFQYSIGINIDNIEFNPTSECEKGGLYFVIKEEIIKYYFDYGNKIAKIIIMDDSLVYIETSKFKTNKFIIIEIFNLCEFLNNFCDMNEIMHYYYKFKKVEDFSKLYIYNQLPYYNYNQILIEYIKNLDDNIIYGYEYNDDDIIVNRIFNLFRVNVEQELKIIDTIFNINILSQLLLLMSRHINNFPLFVQKLLLNKNGLLIQYIKNQNERLQIIAYKQNKDCLQFILYPCEELQKIAMNSYFL